MTTTNLNLENLNRTAEMVEAQGMDKYITTEAWGKMSTGDFQGAVLAALGDESPIKMNDLDHRVYKENADSHEFTESITDSDALETLVLVENNTGGNLIPKGRRDEALAFITGAHRFNPIQDMFTDLPEWDGTERATTMLSEVWKLTDKAEYHKVVSALMAASIAIRGRNTSTYVKQDAMFVLTGPADLKKSTFVQSLVWNERLFEDNATADTKDNDNAMMLSMTLVDEIAEMAEIKKYAVNKVKAALSQKNLTFRPPYAHYQVNMPFHNTLFATTNDSRILNDVTGNRKFVMIDVEEKADTDLMTKEYMQQLYSEVIYKYDHEWNKPELTLKGIAEVLGYDPEQIIQVANDLRADHSVHNELHELIGMILDGEEDNVYRDLWTHLTDEVIKVQDDIVVAININKLSVAISTVASGEWDADYRILAQSVASGSDYKKNAEAYLKARGFKSVATSKASVGIHNQRGWWIAPSVA